MRPSAHTIDTAPCSGHIKCKEQGHGYPSMVTIEQVCWESSLHPATSRVHSRCAVSVCAPLAFEPFQTVLGATAETLSFAPCILYSSFHTVYSPPWHSHSPVQAIMPKICAFPSRFFSAAFGLCGDGVHYSLFMNSHELTSVTLFVLMS